MTFCLKTWNLPIWCETLKRLRRRILESQLEHSDLIPLGIFGFAVELSGVNYKKCHTIFGRHNSFFPALHADGKGFAGTRSRGGEKGSEN